MTSSPLQTSVKPRASPVPILSFRVNVSNCVQSFECTSPLCWTVRVFDVFVVNVRHFSLEKFEDLLLIAVASMRWDGMRLQIPRRAVSCSASGACQMDNSMWSGKRALF
jgi:hypothetical protein